MRLGFDLINSSLLYHLKSGVGHECFGDADAFGGLVVFEDGGYDARQGEG
jgi:hypothetical protein